MKLSFPSAEFDDVVAGVCHGCATEAEMRALNELLRSNAGARDQYLFQVEIHSRLASNPDLFSQFQANTAGVNFPALKVGSQGNIVPLNPVNGPANKRLAVGVLAVAACLVLIAGGIGALWFKRSAAGNGATSAAIAMLTRTVDARWSPKAHSLRVGSALG